MFSDIVASVHVKRKCYRASFGLKVTPKAVNVRAIARDC